MRNPAKSGVKCTVAAPYTTVFGNEWADVPEGGSSILFELIAGTDAFIEDLKEH